MGTVASSVKESTEENPLVMCPVHPVWLQEKVPEGQPNLGDLPDSSEIVKSIVPLCMSATCYLFKAYDSVNCTFLVAIWSFPSTVGHHPGALH